MCIHLACTTIKFFGAMPWLIRKYVYKVKRRLDWVTELVCQFITFKGFSSTYLMNIYLRNFHLNMWSIYKAHVH